MVQPREYEAKDGVAKPSNPYQSPTPVDVTIPWWRRIFQRMTAQITIPVPDFFAGDSILHGGIAFWIDPEQPHLLFAGSPSQDLSDRRFNLIVSETIRALPEFLSDHPEFSETLRDRHLCVGVIQAYQTKPDGMIRERCLEWDLLQAILDTPDADDSSAQA